MSEAHEPERDTLDSFRRVVHGFSRRVADVRAMPSDDLGGPPCDGAAEATDREGHLALGEATADLGDPLFGEVGVGVIVDLTHGFFRL